MIILPCLRLSLGVMIGSCNNPEKEADMIITNARIWTGNAEQPYAEAMAVSGDTIVALGSNREVLKYRSGSGTVADMGGRFVAPGFIDSHIHMLQGGSNLASVQLRDAATPEVFISRIKEYAATLNPGEWILGGDWDGKGWESLPHVTGLIRSHLTTRCSCHVLTATWRLLIRWR